MNRPKILAAMRTIGVPMALVLVSVIACSGYLWLLSQQRQSDMVNTIRNSAMPAVERIQRYLIEMSAATYPMRSAIRQYGDNFDFDAFALRLLKEYDGLINIQLARHGIVSHIYPIDGHEQAIGHDLFGDPNRKQIALRSIDINQLHVTGPIDLIQGGRAIIGRLPVFTNRESDSWRFWGFTTTLISVEKTLAHANLDSQLLEQHGLNYVLTSIDPTTGSRRLIARSTPEALPQAIPIHVNLPGAQWELAVAPQDGWSGNIIQPSEWLLIMLVMALTLLYAGYQITQPARLSRRIDRKTAQLAEANSRLRNEAQKHQNAVDSLIESEARWRELVTYAGDGLLVHDGQSRISEANEQAAQLFGMTREQLMLTDVRAMPSGTPAASLQPLLSRATDLIDTVAQDELMHADGTRIPVEVATTLLVETSPPRYLTSIRDISERRAAELALEAAHEGLEGRVTARSVELRNTGDALRQEITAREATQHRLNQTRISAEASLAAKNRFLANVSHEIRTPINGLLGMLTLLDDEPLDKETRALVRTALEAGEQLLALLNNLLHLARFEAQKQQITHESIDPQTFSSQILAQAKISHPELLLRLDVDANLPATIEIDIDLTGQILDQLIGWIATHTTESQQLLTVRHGQCRCIPRLVFEIHGQHWHTEELNKDQTASLQYTVGRELINLLDGDIQWQSAGDNGCSCRLSLPLDPATASADRLNPTQRQHLAGIRIAALTPFEECAEGWLALRRAGPMIDTRTGNEQIHEWLPASADNPLDFRVVCSELDPEVLNPLRQWAEQSRAEGPLQIELGGQSDATSLATPIRYAELATTLLALQKGRSRMLPEPVSRNVLIVDDDTANRMVVGSLLRTLGHVTDEAESGPEALEMLRKRAYDIIMLDIRMPGMDGYATTRAIRQIEVTSEQPRKLILAMTALDAGEQLAEALDSGMDGVLEKPLNAERLRDQLDNWQP